MIAVTYSFLFVALVISAGWNVKQARDRQNYTDAAYIIGFEHGGNFVKDAVIRAFAARARADEALAALEARQHAQEESEPSPTPEVEPPL